MFDFNIMSNTKVYVGADKVVEGLSQYRRDLDIVAINDAQGQTADIVDWARENQFHILIHRNTRQIAGIRTTFKTELQSWELLFSTEYIPVACAPHIIPEPSVVAITTVANNVLTRFLCEVKGMFLGSAMPLFLLEHDSFDNYLAWSLQEDKYVRVFGYKSYRHDFYVSDVSNSSSPTPSDGRYVIIPPSDSLIKGLGLHLYSSIYRKKCQWNKWVPRAPIVGCCDVIPEFYQPRYAVCIDTLNRSYAKDLGYDEEFSRLEQRVKRLERFCQLHAPKACVDKEIALIERVLPLLENLK